MHRKFYMHVYVHALSIYLSFSTCIHSIIQSLGYNFYILSLSGLPLNSSPIGLFHLRFKQYIASSLSRENGSSLKLLMVYAWFFLQKLDISFELCLAFRKILSDGKSLKLWRAFLCFLLRSSVEVPRTEFVIIKGLARTLKRREFSEYKAKDFK